MPAMGVGSWLLNHWIDLLQSAGIISGLVFTAYSVGKDADARKIQNLIALSERHHAIWKQVYDSPDLLRIKDERAALDTHPVTPEEQRFVISLIVHLDTVYRATKAKMFVNVEGVQKDIKSFFSLPIPKTVWDRVKPLQDKGFVEFVEGSLR
jgi:hypothetical protein